MTVTAQGGRIVVTVNGHQSAEIGSDPGRREGRFALQVHGSEDCDLWFKDLEIREE
ncbi:MAG: DUF1080 domain-containing protein [Verrucomicrobia bacterium]|nr:DUF1080 domain-containing protein [Verrucomicrobiota bacterium]